MAVEYLISGKFNKKHAKPLQKWYFQLDPNEHKYIG